MSGLSNVVSALKVSEKAIQIAGKNISNVNTEGYKRQRVVQYEEVGGSAATGFQMGLGARIECVQQLYNQLKEEAYQDSLANLGELEVENDIYTYLQTMIGLTNTSTDKEKESKSALASTLDDIWTAANSLSTDPSSLTYRTAFHESLVTFLEEAETLMTKLDSLQEEVNTEMGEVVNKINDYADEICKLNERINTATALGRETSELKDQRSQLIEDLSNLVEVELETYPNTESILIRIDGTYLVTQSKVNKIELAQNQATSIYDVPVWSNTGNKVEVTSGRLKGLLDSRGHNIVGNLTDPTNGSPNEKADIVISIDPTMDATKLDEIINNIDSMTSMLDANGSNYKLLLNVMGSGTVQSFDDGDALKTYLQNNGVSGSSDVLGSVINLDTTQFRDNSNKYFMVFTDNSLTGSQAQVNASIEKLNSLDMRVITVTDKNDQAVVNSWSNIIENSDGCVYSLDSELEEIGENLAYNINARLDDKEYDGIIAEVKSQINSLVSIVVRSINEVFTNGINSYGEQNDGSLDIFQKVSENLPWQIGNIKINAAFSDLNNLPLTSTGEVGDNTLVAELVELRNKSVVNDSGISLTIDGYFEKLVLELGSAASTVEGNLEAQETIVKDADNARKAVSGISLDEELANVIKFQYAYTGASRMLTVLDEMTEVIESLV